MTFLISHLLLKLENSGFALLDNHIILHLIFTEYRYITVTESVAQRILFIFNSYCATLSYKGATMSRLALYFLGPPLVNLDGASVEINRRKVLSLLIYLAVTAQRHSRDELAELLERYPDRFVAGAASLPMNDVDAALIEAERAINELHLNGVQIYSSINGKPLDRPEYIPLYEMMADFDLPILIFPSFVVCFISRKV